MQAPVRINLRLSERVVFIMPGSFFGLEIARRGLDVSRKAIDITSQNIANASTEGYSRQQAVMGTTDPWTLPGIATKMEPGQLGTGVQIDQIKRIRDYYLDLQYRQSASYEGYWQKKLDMAQQIEAVFPEPDGQGIQAVVLTFFNDWQDLNNNPQDSGVKSAVKESGDELASVFRQMHNQLVTVGESISGSMDDQANKINELLNKIADVSNAITSVIANGAQPNDLLDKRDKMLDELAGIGQINVQAKDSGAITVKFIGNDDDNAVITTDETGKVTASQVFLELTDNVNCLLIGEKEIDLTELADYQTGVPDSAGQGSLLGLESSRLENQDILRKLDNLAAAIINNVNEKAGITFFTGSGTSDIALDTAVNDNPNSIDGNKALAVAQLRSTPLEIGESQTVTIEGYYQGIVAQIGGAVDYYNNMLDNQQAIGDQVNALRQSVSGVSLDEELIKAMQYQYGYQASARMLNIQNEMLDYLINNIQ